MKFLVVFIYFLLGLSLVSCSFNGQNEKPLYLETTNPSEPEILSVLSYGGIAKMVFIPKCVSCHGDSGNINLESYTEVIKNLSLIKKAVFIDKTMPKRGSLTKEQWDALWNWIEVGAPEQPQNGNPPVTEPLLTTYASIDKNVFQTSCKDCHNPDGSGKRIMLDRESLLNSPLELVIPGNPDESGLIIAIERSDDKRMPPEKFGYSALSNETKTIIRKWIENGADD